MNTKLRRSVRAAAAEDGAVAVLCDDCMDTQPRFFCTGYPATDGRTPYDQLPAEKYEHDKSKHQDDF